MNDGNNNGGWWMPRTSPQTAPAGVCGVGLLTGLGQTIVELAYVLIVLAIGAVWWFVCAVTAYVFISPAHARAWAAWWWAHRTEPAPQGGGWAAWWWAHRSEAPPGGVPSNVVRLLPRRDQEEGQ